MTGDSRQQVVRLGCDVTIRINLVSENISDSSILHVMEKNGDWCLTSTLFSSDLNLKMIHLSLKCRDKRHLQSEWNIFLAAPNILLIDLHYSRSLMTREWQVSSLRLIMIA